MLDEILNRLGFKYEDLSAEEVKVLDGWLQVLNKNELSVGAVTAFLRQMREVIEQKLIDEPEFIYIFFFKFPNRNQIMLKARLKNCMLLEAFLTSPEKAKQSVENAITAIAGTRRI